MQAVGGLAIFLQALFMHNKLEIEGDFEAEETINIDPTRSGIHLRRTFSQEIAHNYHVIRNALKVKELQRTFLFYILLGLTCPILMNFMYYFKLEVGVSQFSYQMIGVLGGVYLVIAVMIYQTFLQQYESRTLIRLTLSLYIASGIADLGFVLRWNVSLGIADTTWLIFGSTAIENLRMGLTFLVPFVLVSKITPAHVEATVFALSASIINISFGWGIMIGAAWNHFFFHVSADNMDNLYKLIIL